MSRSGRGGRQLLSGFYFTLQLGLKQSSLVSLSIIRHPYTHIADGAALAVPPGCTASPTQELYCATTLRSKAYFSRTPRT